MIFLSQVGGGCALDIFTIRNLLKTKHISIFDLPLRVTYYARVSTKSDAHLNSIENQISHFEELIRQNTKWTFVEGYVDEIRGESAANRDNFLRMIADAKMGKFDFILTKEISCFARDLLDSVSYTRELLTYGVCVLFRKRQHQRLGLRAAAWYHGNHRK